MCFTFVHFTDLTKNGFSTKKQIIGWQGLCHFRDSIDVSHEKTDLKVFVVVQEGLAGWGPANPSLGITPTREYNL